MEDVLVQHALRVQSANEDHLHELQKVKEDADRAIKERLLAFGAKVVETVRGLDEARVAAMADIDAILNEAASDAAAAFAANSAALTASSVAMHAEIEARTRFMTTGSAAKQAPHSDGQGTTTEGSPSKSLVVSGGRSTEVISNESSEAA